MANTFGQSDANETGGGSRGSGAEMKAGANSSAAENGSPGDDSPNEGVSKPHVQPSETDGKGVNPGRTPGKAEGVEDAEDRGNQ